MPIEFKILIILDFFKSISISFVFFLNFIKKHALIEQQ